MDESYDGLTIRVTFGYSSTADEPTLNVNGLGAKYLAFGNTQVTSINSFHWAAGATITFVCEDNGDDYLWVPQGYPRNYYGTSSTAASTTAKTASVGDSNFVLCKGTTVVVKFTYANTVATPTLNISSTGACTIFAYDATLSTSSVYNWGAKATIAFTFDGRYWQMNSAATDGLLTAWCYANNTTYIDGSKIYTGTIGVEKIKLYDVLTVYKSSSSTEIGGYLGYLNGSTGVTKTIGIGMYRDESEVIATEAGARISYGSDSSTWSAMFVQSTTANIKTNGRIYLDSGTGITAPSMIQSGSTTITTSTAGTPARNAITFGAAFPGTPIVMTTVKGSTDSLYVQGTSVSNISTTGCNIYVTRSETGSTEVMWIAVYTPS